MPSVVRVLRQITDFGKGWMEMRADVDHPMGE